MRPLIVIGFLAVVVLLVVLEGWRQRRAMRRRGERGTAGALLRAGLLELQGHLEPDRKVEILREAESKRDLLVDLDETGDPPAPDRRR
jgi:hypothetical protein